MRIAFLHRSLAGGGTEADLCRMAAGLSTRGHAVAVFTARAGAAPAGVTVRRVPILRGGRLLRLLSFALTAPRVAASYGPFDVVVGFGRTLRQDVVRVGGGTHRSYLRRMQAAGLRGPRLGPYHRAILWIERRQFALPACRRVIAVSALAAGEVQRDYMVPRDRIGVVYNGVDLERFHPAHRDGPGRAFRRRLGIPENAPVCVAVGHGFVRKGFDVLLRMWGRDAVPGLWLVLVGGDERLARWQREAARAPLAGRVVVTGPRDDVPAALAAADVVCVPSRQEAFGNVVLEACAAGVPVVTSRATGAAELLVSPLDALVVSEPDDEEALRRALLLALGPEAPAFRHRARQCAEAWPWERHLEHLERELEEAARGR